MPAASGTARGRRPRALLVVVVLAALTAAALVAAVAFVLPRGGGPELAVPPRQEAPGEQTGSGEPSGPVEDDVAVVVAAGDIACDPDDDVEEDACQHQATADAVASVAPDAVLPLGDLQYPEGELEDFEASYDPTWGRFKDITRPVLGNHEMRDSGGDGYFEYFGEIAGEEPDGWYSFDLGAWHLVALNSECDGCLEEGSEQLDWLREDLEDTDARCTLAYLHRPRFSSDDYHGSDDSVAAVWELLDEAGADVVLASHAHYYERLAPMDADGEPDPEGLRSFVVGTGGASLYELGERRRATQARQNDTFGVLALTLRPQGYDWEFVPAAGGDFQDAGTAACVDS